MCRSEEQALGKTSTYRNRGRGEVVNCSFSVRRPSASSRPLADRGFLMIVVEWRCIFVSLSTLKVPCIGKRPDRSFCAAVHCYQRLIQ